MKNTSFEVVVTGGSYAGLSAALSLGRALRNTLIIDSGKPCNAQTPHSHNFLTQDGSTPAEISELSRKQVAAYPTVSFLQDEVIELSGTDLAFEILTTKGRLIKSKKVILATGIKDILPEIGGLKNCWGISAIHCPYCHGYEFRTERTGILMNGEAAFEQAKLIRQWTKRIFILSNGKPEFSDEQLKTLKEWNIEIVDQRISELTHRDGYIESVRFEDGFELHLKAVYIRPAFEQHRMIADLALNLDDFGFIKTDDFQETSIAGIFAAGDNCTMMRAVANAVSAGTKAGAMVNRALL